MSEKKEKQIHSYYELKGEKIIRKLKKCPRCDSFMALHKSPIKRWACGRCSYTQYITE